MTTFTLTITVAEDDHLHTIESALRLVARDLSYERIYGEKQGKQPVVIFPDIEIGSRQTIDHE